MLTIESTLDQKLLELAMGSKPWYSSPPIDALTQVKNWAAVIVRDYDPDVAPWDYWRTWINSLTWDEFISNWISGVWNWVTPWWTPWLWLYWRNTWIVFSATDHNTVARWAWDINMPDGTTYSISSWNTWNISSVTYIYLDINVSTTVLQTTTTSADAVWVGKIMVCVAQNSWDTSKDAIFQAFGTNSQSLLVTADSIAANTITANEIASNTITASQIATGTITADRMNVSSLSAISANIGTVTAWNINWVTITWWTIRTASSWKRVEITWSNNRITYYNSSWQNTWYIEWNTYSASEALYIWGTDFIQLDWVFTVITSGAFTQQILPLTADTYDLWSSGAYYRDLRIKQDINIDWYVLDESNWHLRRRGDYVPYATWSWASGRYVATSSWWSPTTQLNYIWLTLNGTEYKVLIA